MKNGDERLRKHCRDVTDFGERTHMLLDDMYDTMTEAKGVGLAAPQVGILRRAVVVDIGDESGRHEFINPVIVTKKGRQESTEGCLSIPGEYGVLHRPKYVKVEALDRNGEPFTFEAQEYLAVAICHEIDHLDGILFIDKAERMLEEEDLRD